MLAVANCCRATCAYTSIAAQEHHLIHMGCHIRAGWLSYLLGSGLYEIELGRLAPLECIDLGFVLLVVLRAGRGRVLGCWWLAFADSKRSALANAFGCLVLDRTSSTACVAALVRSLASASSLVSLSILALSSLSRVFAVSIFAASFPCGASGCASGDEG